MDTLLVFQLLGSVSQDRANDLLVLVALNLNRTTTIPPTTPSSTGSHVANHVFFASLSITLVAALAAILVKQWVQAYGLESLSGRSTQETARARARNWHGVEHYRLQLFIEVVPMLLHIGLAVFFVGLLVWSYEGINRQTFYTIMAIIAIGFVAYLVFGIIACFDRTAPFKWPFPSMLRWAISNLKRAGTKTQEMYSKLSHGDSKNGDAGAVSSVPELQQPLVRTSQLITVEPETEDSATKSSYEPLEVEIFREVVEKSLSIDDTCIAIEDIRRMMLYEQFGPLETSQGHSGISLSSSFRQILLQKCVTIGASSISHTEKRLSINPASLNRVRAVGRFLEAYLQTDFGAIDHYDVLRQSSILDLAMALMEHGLSAGSDLADLVLAVSLQALLVHRVFGYGDKGCTACLMYRAPVNQFVKRSDQELATVAAYDRQRARHIHRYFR
ncbi:hypothetical protein FRC17_010085, partial [Serendipita sp. 399]